MTDLAGALADKGDTRPWVAGTVLEVDDAASRVTVEVDGVALVLRRVAAAYRPGDVVAVVRDPGGSGAGQYIAGTIGPVASRWAWGEVTAVAGSPTYRLTVDVDGTSYSLPHVAGTYAATDQVAVLLDPASQMGGLVLGLINNPSSNPTAPTTPEAPTVVTTSQVGPVPITPTWSGTYRVDRAAWDRWNTTNYGGRSDAYQGAGSGSGLLIGLVTYGTKLANLGAESIDALTLRLRSNGAGYASSLSFIVQGSPHGSRPAGSPSYSGTTATSSSIARVGGSTTVSLPADVREGFRTGSVQGLAVVGSTYGGLYGTSRADGLALSATYTKKV